MAKLSRHLGFTMRARLFLAFLVTGLAPHAAVFAFSQVERPVYLQLQRTTDAATLDARAAALSADAPAALREVAARHQVRVRLYDREEQLALDVDQDRDRVGVMNRLERLLVTTATAAELREAERGRGPPPERPEYAAGRVRGTYVDCELDAYVFCQGVATVLPGRPFVVHVQKTSLRAVGPVYALRDRMLRLTFFMVALATVVAFFLSRQLSKPLARLRDKTLEKATAAHAVADLPEDADDEIAQVGRSFNVLLHALDERRRATSAFMADAVHEVKNPVAAIRAAAESLSAGEAPPERQRRIARIVQESATRLDRLVSELLDLSRAEAGMPGEERAAVDLAALAAAVAEGVAADPRFGKVEVHASCAVDRAIVDGVSSRLEAMVRELLTNGASFCEERGGKVEVAVSADADEVTVQVEDDGPGIDASDLEHVFDRFYTTRAERKGTGLGLAMVKAVVEAHGGRVMASAGREGGARFTVRLPRARGVNAV
ncbi:MAG: HAMP domain-containing histidine kinase [Myxococcales bacterium]|nr:HAMP domain-containing histidine kinase [Myxococcales bacterium]